MFTKQMLVLDGILNGIFQKHASLQNIIRVNIMIGIVTAGLEFITNLILLLMEKLENSQLLYPYVMEKNIKEETLK